MADQNNTDTRKIDVHISVEGENNVEIEKIDIAVTAKGKIKFTVQDGERECLLKENSPDMLWIDQVKRRHRSGKHKERGTSSVVSIYRVPEFIKKNKREAYEPVVVYLGPYHHKKHQQLTAMDEYKLQAVDRTVEKMPDMTIERLVSGVKELEKEIRDCYEDSAIDWDGDTLSWIMTMDACFILQFLQMDLPNSSLIFQPERWWNIKRKEIELDIIKMENQIPFIILRKITELVNRSAPVEDLAIQLMNVGAYCRGYPFSLRDDDYAIRRLTELIERSPCHLLDLSTQVIGDFFSNSHGNRTEYEDISSNSVSRNEPAVSCCLHPSSAVDSRFLPSAEKLQRAGIKLKPNTEGKFHFQPRYFRHSTLFVPQITVDDDTEVFLRNLVAFEVCQMREGSSIKRVVSDNMYVMDQLINSTEDVKLFERADIIKNFLGSTEEVAKIFNDLCIGVTRGKTFDYVFEKVNKHYKSQLIVLLNQFREKHFSKPWYIVPVVAALILLVMTLLQTIYTMKGYFRT